MQQRLFVLFLMGTFFLILRNPSISFGYNNTKFWRDFNGFYLDNGELLLNRPFEKKIIVLSALNFDVKIYGIQYSNREFTFLVSKRVLASDCIFYQISNRNSILILGSVSHTSYILIQRCIFSFNSKPRASADVKLSSCDANILYSCFTNSTESAIDIMMGQICLVNQTSISKITGLGYSQRLHSDNVFYSCMNSSHINTFIVLRIEGVYSTFCYESNLQNNSCNDMFQVYMFENINNVLKTNIIYNNADSMLIQLQGVFKFIQMSVYSNTYKVLYKLFSSESSLIICDSYFDYITERENVTIVSAILTLFSNPVNIEIDQMCLFNLPTPTPHPNDSHLLNYLTIGMIIIVITIIFYILVVTCRYNKRHTDLEERALISMAVNNDFG